MSYRCEDCGVTLSEGEQRIYYGKRVTLILCVKCQEKRLKRRNMEQAKLTAY